MSQQTPSAPPVQPYFEDEIDLRPYIETVIRHWWLIVGLAVVAATVAFIIGSLGPDTYTAEADVALLSIRSQVTFDPEFTTVPQAESGDVRRQALQSLATSRSLVAEVYAQVKDRLKSDTVSFGSFQDAFSIETAGDLLRLQVSWTDPEVAAAIANEWARLYTEVANRSYVTTSSQTPEEAGQAAEDAFGRYETAQQAYEAFIAENELDQVQREIAQLDVLITDLQRQKTAALQFLNVTPAYASTQFITNTREVLIEQMNVAVERDARAQTRQLDAWYDRKANLERLRNQLQDVRQRVEAGETSTAVASGDALALMFARAGLFDQRALPDLLLQLDPDQLGQSGANLTVSDVDTLLTSVENGIDEADREIERLSEETFLGSELTVPAMPDDHRLFAIVNEQANAMLNLDAGVEPDSAELAATPLSRTLDRFSERRQELLARAEQLKARQQELEHKRDTLWDLYETLDNKAREVEAQFATGSPQARVAAEAVPIDTPDRRGRLRQSLIAAVLGGMVGLFYAFAREYWEASAVETEDPSAQEPQPVHG